MAKKYSNKTLENIIASDTPFPFSRKLTFEYYYRKTKQSIKSKGWDMAEFDGDDGCNDLIVDTAVWDLYDEVKALAQIILDERESRKKTIEAIKDSMQQAIYELKHL